MVTNRCIHPTDAEVIFYLGQSHASRTRMVLATLPITPRTVIYTYDSQVHIFRQQYSKSMNRLPFCDELRNVCPLFGPMHPRILSLTDGFDPLDDRRVYDHLFFEQIPTTPLDACKTLALASLFAMIALKGSSTVIACINTRCDEESLIFESLLKDIGISNCQMISFWLNSEDNTSLRYVRVSAKLLAGENVNNKKEIRESFCRLLSVKSPTVKEGSQV